jgi:hypothetical protein
MEPDWERIEADYRAGVKPLRSIAAEHGISETAIRKRAKRDQWPRDLSQRIAARAEEKMQKREAEAVRKMVRKGRFSQLSLRTERDIVEANAISQVEIRVRHRTEIARARESLTELRDRLKEMRGEVTDMESAATCVKLEKDFATALASVIEMERKAYAMDASADAERQAGARIAVEFVNAHL